MKSLVRLSLILSLAGPLYACGDKPDAAPSVEETNPRAFFKAGITYLSPDKKGVINYSSAYEQFARAEALGGGKNASFNAGWVAEIVGRPDKAIEHYRKAYVADKGFEKAMFSLARTLKENDRADQAVELYQDFLKANPENLEVRNDLVLGLSKAKRYDEATAEAQEILRKDPKNAAVYRSLSAMYFDRGMLGMSQLCNELTLKLNKGDVGTYNNMGVTYLLQDDIERAIEKFKTAIKLDSQNFEANANLGFVALNSGDYKLALNCFTAATTSNPKSLDARVGLAVALRGTGDYAKSAAIYDDLIKSSPKNKIAYYNAATLQEKYVKNFTKAEKYLRAFVDSHAGEIGPNHQVFERIDRIKKSKAEQVAREQEILRQEREEAERQKRNEALLKELVPHVDATEKRLQDNAHCFDEGSIEMGAMIIEQARMVIEAKESDMAPDMKTFLDDFSNGMEDGIANCAAAPAPAPAPAPEGTEEPPAEEGGE